MILILLVGVIIIIYRVMKKPDLPRDRITNAFKSRTSNDRLSSETLSNWNNEFDFDHSAKKKKKVEIDLNLNNSLDQMFTRWSESS